MKTTYLSNPFYCYILSFGLALIIYSWGWSEIYPQLTIEVVLFLLSSFAVSFYFGKKISPGVIYKEIEIDKRNELVVVLIMLGYIAEFVYNGGIPIFFIIIGRDISYMDFGIPTFHVVIHTFTSFYAVYICHQYVSTKKKHLLLMLFLVLVPNILIVNRGALVMTLTACLIVYLASLKKIKINKLITVFIIACVFFYGFGYLGNARSFNGDPVAFLRLTKATDNFLESSIPKEFYWFYIYSSSPFANFQNATIFSTIHEYNVGTFITWEFLPDFISKRIIPINLDNEGNNRLDYSINPILTVGSIYFEPFIRMGWSGPISIFFFYVGIVYLYAKSSVRHSKYFTSALSILCVISVFNVFENMINFSGLIFQLVFPLVLNKIDKYKFIVIGFNDKKISYKLNIEKLRFKL